MRFRRVIIASSLALAAVAGTGALLWRMTQMPPTWYQPADINNQAAAALAQAVENRIIEELHKLRPADQTWTLRLRAQHLNAWLTARLPRWLIHEQNLNWPQQLGPPQLRFTRKGIDLALQLSPNDQPRFITLRVLPRVEYEQLFIPFERLYLGRIPALYSELDDLITWAADYGAAQTLQTPEAQWLLQLLAESESLQPQIVLADQRTVMLLDLRLHDGHIDLKLQTLPPELASD